MAKFTITYELEVDIGQLAPEAFAEYLFKAELSNSDWNVWETAKPEQIKCTDITPKESK